MKKAILYISLLLSIAACTENKNNLSSETGKTTVEARQSLSLTDLKGRFKYTDLDSFQVDTMDWETRPGFYQELDSSTFKLIWQDGKRNFIGQGYDRDYYYSWQTRNPELIEFVVLTQDESSYCDLLQYCIYDKNGKAIDNFILAASCGDGGWVYQSSGKFITEDTYEEVSVETESEIVASGNIKEIIEGDSIVTRFIIGKDGKVTKKEISKARIREEI
ncbi:hypothetical protein [Pontibacter virosus]|nr:hypothetical protein [Pontibacter virosus]